jgi:hypothetical protein
MIRLAQGFVSFCDREYIPLTKRRLVSAQIVFLQQHVFASFVAKSSVPPRRIRSVI